MANRTVKDAHSVKGTNPQYLVEKIIRTRIYECRYWKEECFALSGKFHFTDFKLSLVFVFLCIVKYWLSRKELARPPDSQSHRYFLR